MIKRYRSLCKTDVCGREAFLYSFEPAMTSRKSTQYVLAHAKCHASSYLPAVYGTWCLRPCLLHFQMFHPRKIKTERNVHVNAEGLHLRLRKFCTLIMKTTLMYHLRIVLYKESVTIVQIQIPFHAIVWSWTLLFSHVLLMPCIIYQLHAHTLQKVWQPTLCAMVKTVK